MNIILTGYRATGKTSIGKELSRLLGREFIDTDDLIEKREGQQIKSIFEQKGWQYFRRVEKRVVRDMARLDNKIIAVGGGTFMYKENLILLENAKVVLLIAPLEVIAQRMASDSHRPPLTKDQSSIDEIREVWNRRKERYYALADLVVDTGESDPAVAAQFICEKLRFDLIS